MKAIGIVFLALGILMIGITMLGAAREAGGEGAMALVRCVQARLTMYFTPGVTWVGIGVCCLGLDAVLKKKGQAVALGGSSGSAAAMPEAGGAPSKTRRADEGRGEEARRSQPAGAPVGPRQGAAGAPKEAGRAVAPAQPAAGTPKPPVPVKPVRPAIRPASDDRPKRDG